MASHIRRTEGGGFAKQERFYDQHDNSKVTPGPIYTPPSFLSDHVQGPVYKGGHEPVENKPLGDPNLPHPSRDRTAWMIGITKNDLAYYSNIAAHMGPAFYAPSDRHTAPLSPRNAFSKNKRFSSLTHRYMSKEHNQANLCTASPGPKYYPKNAHIDMRSATLPAYTFGGKGMTHRSSFLDSMVKDGYMYTARPATNDASVNVGPSNYTPRDAIIGPAAPRQQWTKADRFKDMDARYISAKHARSKKGLNSPGPCYNPTLYDIAQPKTRPAHVPTGKWCP